MPPGSEAETSNSSLLGISEGSVVWVVGDTEEELSLVDPHSEVVDEPVHGMDAVILVVDRRAELPERLDDVLPAIGSTENVWLVYPSEGTDLEPAWLREQVADYGWTFGTAAELEDDWTAVPLRQE
jgi:hypothetical protein